MTDEKEIRELIKWAESQGATVTHNTFEEDGRTLTDSVQVANLKGCGPFPMDCIGFAERMRQLRGNCFRVGSIVKAQGWRGEWVIVEYDPTARRPYGLRSASIDKSESARFPNGFGSLAPVAPAAIWVTLEEIATR